MQKKIKNNIWQLCFRFFGSCVYLVKLDYRLIMIDTGSPDNEEELVEDLKSLGLEPSEIDVLLLTHNHPDHTGNMNIFKNAKIFGSKKDFSDIRVNELINLNIPEIETIKTPGHTRGSVCFYMPKEKVLFSGDTIFHIGIGRTDFSNSSPIDMIQSLKKIQEVDYETLCPGHI